MSILRSSIRSDLNALIREEIVKRFETVIKEEIDKHNRAVEKSNKELSETKALFSDHKKGLLSWKEESHADREKILVDFNKAKEELKKDHSRQDKYLAEKGDELKKLTFEFLEKSEMYLPIADFSAFKESVLDEFKTISKIFALDMKNHKEEGLLYNKKLIQEMEEKHRALYEEVSSLKKMVEDFKSSLETNIVDATGISRMLKVANKSIFIAEKKIENLYTLLERITGKEEECPKAE